MNTTRTSRLQTGARAVACGLLLSTCTPQDNGGATLEGQAALVTTTDYQSGAYSAIRLSDLAQINTIEIVHQDSVCRYDPITGFPYIVQRLGADSIAVVDTRADWLIVNEYSVGAGSNPHDIAVVAPDRAFVSLFGEDHLLVVHPTEGTVIEEIDLSSYSDADGLPEASGLVHLDGTVFATLQRLSNLQPVNQAYLLEIDGATGDVLGEHALARTPSGRLRWNPVLERVVLVESGSFSDPTDGGIELFDPATGQLSGLTVTEEQLGGDIVDAVLASESVGFAVVGTGSDSVGHTRVVMFDPSTGAVTRTLEEAEAWNHMYLELTPDHSRLWLGERRSSDPGIRIFDAVTGDELTESPLSTGLPPFTICFVEYE